MAEHSPPRAVVLDIEGTTTPISFVHEVLFPYARARIPEMLRTRGAEPAVAALIREAAQLAGADTLDIEASVKLFLSWSDADRKIPVLKRLQGMIWKQGYLDGVLRSPVFADVPPALRAWSARGMALFVYSSGAVEAQQLLFRYTDHGDLTGYFDGYFDATLGAKTDEQSYRLIQTRIEREPHTLLFLSDNVAEIAAARAAGWSAVLVERAGPVAGRVPPVIERFDELTW